MSQATPSLETAYESHRGMLFGVFGKLASQGFVAQPMDAADIVHDFFVEEWPGLQRRFDPARATAFSTYLYTAFVRFARARIQRLHRQQGMLLAPQELLQLQDTLAAAPSPEESVDLGQADVALADLEPQQRRLIEKWLARYPYSERELAREMGTSRYKLRERLVEAVGRVSLHFAADTGKSEVDHRVAEAIWRDRLTPEEAAATLGLTVQQVRNAYARSHQRIVQSLVPRPAQPGRTRSAVMSEESLKMLLSRIFSDAPIERVEAEVAQQAPALVQYLVESDAAVADRWQGLPEERLARVYEAIARGMGGADVAEPDVNEEDPLFIAHANDRRAVGHAFAEALVPGLPEGIFPLLRACQARVRVAPRDVVEQLRHEPDVLVGGNAALTLVEFGITPSHLVVAADAITMLIERAMEAEHFPRGQKLLFQRTHSAEKRLPPLVQALTDEASGASLSRDELAPEIGAVATVDDSVSEVLLDWLVSSAPFTTSLFSGFAAELSHANVLLKPVVSSYQVREDNLYSRWASPWALALFRGRAVAAAAAVADFSQKTF